MADITRKRLGELLRNLFEILMAHPEGMRGTAALEALTKVVELTDFEKGSYSAGVRRFERIVRFASIVTVKAGWLVKAKGTWTVTEAGRAAHARLKDPEAFYREGVRLYRAWKATRPVSDETTIEAPDELASDASETEVGRTFEEAEEQAWNEVDKFLRQMNPYDFQELVSELLQAMGYHVAWVAPPGRDGGIDILAFSDPLGAKPPRIKVQVKRHQGTIPVDGLRSFLAVLGDEDVGIFVNVGGFTRDAQEEARTQEKRRITLIDLERLFDLWVEHYDKLSDSARRRMPLKPIHFLAPAE